MNPCLSTARGHRQAIAADRCLLTYPATSTLALFPAGCSYSLRLVCPSYLDFIFNLDYCVFHSNFESETYFLSCLWTEWAEILWAFWPQPRSKAPWNGSIDRQTRKGVSQVLRNNAGTAMRPKKLSPAPILIWGFQFIWLTMVSQKLKLPIANDERRLVKCSATGFLTSFHCNFKS